MISWIYISIMTLCLKYRVKILQKTLMMEKKIGVGIKIIMT